MEVRRSAQATLTCIRAGARRFAGAAIDRPSRAVTGGLAGQCGEAHAVESRQTDPWLLGAARDWAGAISAQHRGPFKQVSVGSHCLRHHANRQQKWLGALARQSL